MNDFYEVKTVDLVGAALDHAVAIAVGYRQDEEDCSAYWAPDGGEVISISKCGVEEGFGYRPSSNWAHGGPMLELVGAVVSFGDEWQAFLKDGKAVRSSGFGASYLDVDSGNGDADGVGETPMVAVCRAIVAAKLGDLVQVPARLINGEDASDE